MIQNPQSGLSSRKKIVTVVCVISFLCLQGSVFYKPVLKNSNLPFIELSGSVGKSIGNANQAYTVANSKTNSNTNPTPTPKAQPTKPVETEKKMNKKPVDEVEVTVCDEEIKVGVFSYTDINVFVDAVRDGKFEGKRVMLYDDYAEAKTFIAIIKVFEEMDIRYEINP